jgi:hypothetical protein
VLLCVALRKRGGAHCDFAGFLTNATTDALTSRAESNSLHHHWRDEATAKPSLNEGRLEGCTSISFSRQPYSTASARPLARPLALSLFYRFRFGLARILSFSESASAAAAALT